MNYFEHHIGDYAEATAHLSFVEDAAYSRCIRKYYAKEKPLPADMKAVQRLVGARTKEEKDAVETVLAEFFVLGEDGWRNARCDADIAAFLAGEPEREAKKANEETRLKRHREERAALFQQLTAAGLHAAWNTTMKELRKMVAGLPATVAATAEPETPETQPATAPATPVTATQTPIPTTHTPSIHTSLSANSADEQKDDQKCNGAEQGEPAAPKYTPEDEACAQWLFDRIKKTNPNHKLPKLATWANDVRLMRESDKRTHREICELFGWAQDDSFWRANILSPSKLRSKWDQLNIKRGTPQKGQQHGNFGAQDYRKGVGADGSF
ncbi:DUF1376 domain-containing protein [Duganella sp. FT80W]|uniref:DUF1376 domain-containing protein n=1 Tax=Duganella guangzhouensis TaxID=2666084 RepID=A0A6I2KXA3_9BURK|nr:DUF1376 domain-containing protein [Duganella guangzhouensis]